MDEDIEIINTQTRNEKIKNFFINNKNSLISILVIIILALIGYFSFEEYQSSKREKLADKYDLAVIRYEADNKYNVIPDLKEVINAKDKTYSPLAFYFLLDNDLINSKEEINNFFDEKTAEDDLHKIIGITYDPIVSSDVVGNSLSGIVDGLSTMCIDDNKLKLIIWFDNGWGYASRIIEAVTMLGSQFE